MSRFLALLTLIVSQTALGQSVSDISISPRGAVLQAGSSQKFSASCTYTNGATDDCSKAGGAIWSSSRFSAMTVNSTGVATWVTDPGANGFATGFAIAAAGGHSDNAAVFGQHPGDVWTTYVTPEPGVATANINGTKLPMTVTVGATVALGYGFQINGNQNNPIQNTCTWSSSNPSVATINRIGHVTAVAPGSVTLTCGRAGNAVYGASSNGAWLAPGNVIQLTIVNGGTGNQTWYVRPDGGLPYTNAAETPVGQCDGKSDAPYPGTGVNQPCAMGNLRYLWSDEVSYIHIGWMISGGDTVIVRQNPIGYAVGGDLNGPLTCHGNPYDCFMPTIPSGTAGRHTQILGENFGNCASDATKTKLYLTYGGQTAFNLKDSQFVDIACFDISDRSPYAGGNFSTSCPGGTVDCGGAYGIYESALTASANYTDLIIHGLQEAIHGATGVGVVMNRVHSRGNRIAGIDMDDSPFGLSNVSVAGGLTLTNSTIEFSGCNEEYPVVHSYPYTECRDQSTGGYGDGLGTASTSGDWIFDRDTWFANFQDGLDLLHSGMRTLSVTNSQSIANDGQAYKIGSAEHVIFRNNIAVVNCARIHYTFGDEPAGAIVPGVSPCRAAGDGLLFSFTDQGTYLVQNNSFTGYDSTLFDLGCEGGWDYCTNAGSVFQNNVVVGYATSLDGGDGRQPGLFYNEQDTMPANGGWAVRDHNFYYGVRYCPSAGQVGETCNTISPGLIGLPANPVTSAYALDNFNLALTATSPLVGAGVALPGILTDIAGLLRTNPPTIGAREYFAGSSLYVPQITLIASPASVTFGQNATLTASVAIAGGISPTGAIVFSVAGVSIGSGYLNSSGVATLSTSTLAVGSYSVIASYVGDGVYGAGASLATTLTVSAAVAGKTTPQVNLTLSSSAVSLLQPVTLTASVATVGGITPTGTLTFFAAGVTIGSATLNGAGIATFTTSSLAAALYSVTASYGGDIVYYSGDSNSVSLTVGSGGTVKNVSTVSLGLSANPIAPLQSLTLTAAVATVGGVAPTGSITFSVGGVAIGMASLNSIGVATLTNSTMTAGNYSITASYAGNSAYAYGASAPVSLTVGSGGNKAVASVSLNLSATYIDPLQRVTLTATVATLGGIVPTGTITFYASGVYKGSVALNDSGNVAVSVNTLTAGTYLITAVYSGDGGFTPGTSNGVTLIVGGGAPSKTPSSVSLNLSANPIATSQPLSLTGTVAKMAGVVPTGAITFYAGGALIGSAALNASGVATLSTSSLNAGTYGVTASYSGDTAYTSGVSQVIQLTVSPAGQAAAVVSLNLSANTITAQQPLDMNASVATVGGVTPTGTVTFYAGSVPLGQSPLNSTGGAMLTTSTLTAGTYTVTASYSGDNVYTAGTSAAAPLTVNPRPKTTAQLNLSLSATSIPFGQSLSFAAAVPNTGGVVATGTVTFYLGGSPLGQAPLDNNGAAAIPVSNLATGTYTVTASYSGDSVYTTATSSAVTLTVGPAKKAAQLILGLSLNTITALQPVSFMANVATIGGVTPTGTIQFYLGGVAVGQTTLNGSGATLSTSSLVAGTYVVTASYSGDSAYVSGTSNSATLTVNPAGKTASQVSLGLSVSAVAVSQPVTLTALAATVGGAVPTGSVTFTAGSVTVGSSALNGAGVATLTTSSLPAGTYAVVAAYSGDASFTAGISSASALTVSAAQRSVSVAVGQPEFGFTVIPGSTRRIFATVVQGATKQVVWTLKSGTATLSSNSGSWVDVTAPATGSSCSMGLASGSYTVTSPTQFTVTATSVDDGTKTTDVTFNVCNPTVQVAVVPFYRTLYAKQPADIQSLITGSVDQNVHWAITSKPLGGDGTLGDTTSRDTVFAASVAGRYTLTATSQADPSQSATATVFVTGNPIPFAGPVTPHLTEPVDCSVDPALGGTVYNVGPSQAFKTLASVPFPTMTAGSTVRIFNEDTSGINPTAYHEYVQLSRAGTATQPIRVCGVPDASGNQPVIDGSGATGRSDTSSAIAGLGLLTLHTDDHTAVWPNFKGSAYIAVEGVHFRNAKSGYSYVAPSGSTGAWGPNSACVRVNQGQNLAFVGNDLDNCGDGVYTAWNDAGGWGGSDLNVLWEGNHLHNNGVANSDSHQMYLEAWGEVVQFNRMDNYTAGGLGANLKSRGLQDVIRYNYFGDGPARQMDLVDVTNGPIYMSFSGFLQGGASSYHATHPTDAYSADQLAAEQEAWNSHYAYGNIYQNSVSIAPIHFSMDSNGNEQARKGSLYWYNNTFNETACTSCQGQTFTMFDTSAGGGNFIPQTEFQTVQSFNNIVWLANPAQMTFQWNNYDAFIGVSGANLITANWGTNDVAGGAGSGWNTTPNQTAYQNAERLNLHLTGFSDKLVTATTVPFSPVSWALTADLQGNQGVPNAVCEMPPRFSYLPSLGFAIPRITGPNMGATDTTAEAAAQMTTLVGPKQYNTHYSNCR